MFYTFDSSLANVFGVADLTLFVDVTLKFVNTTTALNMMHVPF